MTHNPLQTANREVGRSRQMAATCVRHRALRRTLARILALALPLLTASSSSPAHAQQYPDQNCVVTMENRSVPVAADGTYVIPNVPVNPGQYRARVVCQRPDGTVLGSTSPYTVLTPNGSTQLPALSLDPLTAQPSHLKVQVIAGALSSLGATVQLETQAINPDDFAYDYTPLKQGTTYSSSNAAVATVDNNGVVTATGPGTVVITARNDGLASTIFLTSFGLQDSDGDGMPDAYELANGLNPYDPTDAALDSDGDGLTNLQEFQLGTNPHAADTDGDGLNDGDEIKLGTNPLVADTDGDGLNDGDEVRIGTNPLLADTDADGIPDGVEVQIGTNPLVPDVTTTVVGHVTNANGTPYPNASVVTVTYFTGTTDNTGAFTLLNVPVTLGNILVSARAVVGTTIYNGASASTPPVNNGTTNVGTIQLGQSAGQVSGVVNGPDSKPVQGAQMTIVDGTDTRTTVTDGAGIYVVTGLQPGAVSVAAFDPVTSLRGQNTGTLTGGPLTLNISLAAFGTVSGTVRDTSGNPVGAGIPVTLSGGITSTVVTDTLGHYAFSFVPLGGYTIDATDTNGNHGRATATITATAETIKADVQYLGRGTVNGTVSDAQGHAIAGAAVSLSDTGVFSGRFSTTTDSLGAYSFSNVFVGPVSVSATSGTTSTGGTGSGTLTANGQVVTINISLQPTGTLSGTVFRKDGTTAVAGAVVSLSNSALSATANGSGQYSFPAVPLGAYTVMATDPSSADRGNITANLATSGQSLTANINMLGVGTIVATVLDGSGATVSGASVRVSGSSPFNQQQTAVTGANGVATITQQLAGSVQVSATNPVTGLQGSANATVTANSSVAVTINLQPSGAITGKVYKHDATTPLPSAIVQLDGGQQALTDSTGTYTFSTVPSGNHSISVLDVNGNLLAFNNSIAIATQGQTVTANFVIIGRGTVTGHVTNPDGSAAPGIPVQINSGAPGDGNPYGTQTDVNGFYTAALIPVGPYQVIAQLHTPTINEYGTANGTMPADGATTTTDVHLSASLVPSTTSLTDANGFTYPIRENAGMFDGSFGVFAGDSTGHEGASLLSVTLNGNTTPFTGAPFSTSSLSARQVSIEQDGLAGLNVTRRVYVPVDGYFARYLELLNNPTSQDITVDVKLNSYFRPVRDFFKQNGVTALNTDVPHLLGTSSGDTVLNINDPNSPDHWLTLGGPTDRDPFTQDQFDDTPVPAIADVFSGPGASLKPTAATYVVDASGLFSTLTETYGSVRIPAGGTVGILHFVSQENEYAAAGASAARLVQLPNESLTGLTSSDISAVANFTVPAGGTNPNVAALPSITNQITGFVYAADGSTIVPGAFVHVQSSDPIYARTYTTTANSNGGYAFQGSLGGMAIPPENYSAYATHPTAATALTPECAQNGHYTGQGCAIDSPIVNGTFDPGATQSSTDLSFTNTGILKGTVRRGANVLNVSGTVNLVGSAMSPLTIAIQPDGTYLFPAVLPGSYTITAQVTNTLLQGITSANIVGGQTTTADITIGESGAVQGLVTRPDGSLAVNDIVNLRATGTALQAVVDTAGHYAFTDIPIGSYTVDVYDGLSNSAASATVIVTQNATTTQNLPLQSSGSVNGTVTVNDGSSVAALTVTLTSTTSNGTQTLTAVTDANGKFAFSNVKPGSISVHTTTPANLQGTGTGSLPLAGQTVTINISLVSAGNVTGTVFQGDGTTRAPGITVTISPAPLTGSASTTTDSNGVYNFTNEAFGSFTVFATNPANGDHGQSSSQIQANGQLRTVNIQLTGFGTLIAHVVNSSNQAVANAAVTLNSAGGTLNGTTDSSGSVTFSNVVVGFYSFQAHDPVTNLYAYASGTLAYNATQTVTLTLQAVGTIQGTVFNVDGVTPVAGATVQLNAPYGAATKTAADGTYQFTGQSVGGSYSVQARDTNGFARAVAAAQILQTSGQIITQNLTFVGIGTISGTVTNTDGSRAENVQLSVLSKNPTVGVSQTVTTGGDGTYNVAEIPVGPFSITVVGLPSTLAGFASGTITGDGDHETVNIQIQSSTVTLPTTLLDADGFQYPIYNNGVFYMTSQLFGSYPFSSAQGLQVTVNGSSSSFGDNSSPTTAIQSLGGQQIEINQPQLAGLNVTRKIYVPSDGYFARRVEVLENDTASPITASVTISGVERYSTLSPQIITTSNGDKTVNNSVLWAVDDDDNGTQPYPRTQPAHANVFAGTGAATGMQNVSFQTYYYPGFGNNPSYTQAIWTYVYKSVTLPANSKVSFLFFTAQESSAATATTAAQRLEQLPAEALFGLSSGDLATVANFVIPTTPLSAVHPPSTSAQLTGRVLTGDGSLPIVNAGVYAQSTDLYYSAGVSTTSDSSGTYQTPLLQAGTYGISAYDPSTGVTSPTFTGSFTPGVASVSKDIPFTNTGILTGQVKATGAGSIGSGTIYLSMNCLNSSGNYQYCGSASQPEGTDGTFRFLTVLAGPQNVSASLYMPEGGYIYLPQGGSYFGVDIVATQTSNFTFTIPAVGNISGKVTNADGTPAAGITVSASPSNYNVGISEGTKTAADGTYTLTNLTLDTYTVYATDPTTGGQVSKTTTLTQDATNTVNLQFIGKGTVVATVHYANGNVGQNVTLNISTSTAPSFAYAGTTDSNGQFTFNNVPTGAFTIRAYYPNQNFYSTTNGTIVGTGSTQNLAISLTPVGTVQGTLLYANNTPASGQYVYIKDANNIYSSYAQTDSAGAFAMTPVPADRPVSLTSTYFNSTINRNVSANLNNQQVAGDGQTLTVTMRFPGSANVKVTVLKADNTPLTSGYVNLKTLDNSQNYTNSLGSDGTTTFNNVLEGSFVAVADIYFGGFNVGSTLFTVGPANDGATVPVTIHARPQGTVQGQVYAADGTTVIRDGYNVVFTDIDANTTVTTNPSNGDGYSFQNAEAGDSGFTLTASLNNNDASKQTFSGNITAEGQTITHNFTLNVSSISGTVYLFDGVTPVPNANITVAQQNGANTNYFYTTADANGRYQVSGPTAGPVTVTASDDNGVQGNAPVTLPGDTSIVTGVKISLEATGTVMGTVYDSHSQPITNHYVDIDSSADNNGFSTTVYTDDQGHYIATDIPVGNIGVFSFDESANKAIQASGTLNNNGDTLTLNLGNVPPPPGLGTIFGTVYDSDQDPSSGATVTVTPSDGSVQPFTVMTDDNGMYQATGVPIGDVTVQAALTDGSSTDPVTGHVSDYTTPVEIDLGLNNPGSVSGIVTDGSGNPVPNVDVWLSTTGDDSSAWATGTGDDGSYFFGDIPAGTITIQVKDHDTGDVLGTGTGVLPYGGNVTINVTEQPSGQARKQKAELKRSPQTDKSAEIHLSRSTPAGVGAGSGEPSPPASQMIGMLHVLGTPKTASVEISEVAR